MRPALLLALLLPGIGHATPVSLTLQAGDTYAGYATTMRVTGAVPGTRVGFAVSAVGPGGPVCTPELGGACLDLAAPARLDWRTVAPDGTATFTTVIPATFAGDAWLQASTLTPATPATSQVLPIHVVGWLEDNDHDHVRDGLEWAHGGDPTNPDVDGDGLLDGDEIYTWRTNAFRADTDGDGLTDGEEVAGTTNPLQRDTDLDGALDGVEVYRQMNPNHPDTDGDGLGDGMDVWPLTPGPFDSHVVRDVVVSDPAVSLPDPEFDRFTGMVTWQTFDGAELWLAELDLATGALLPADGRGTLVDTQVAPISLGRNGPEWGQTALGSIILYSKFQGPDPVLTYAWDTGAGWQTTPLPGNPVGASPFATEIPGDPDPWVLYVNDIDTPAEQSTYRSFSDPSTAVVLPSFLRGITTRFVLGTHNAVALLDQGGFEQVARVNTANGTWTQVTHHASYKQEVWSWWSPEDGDYVMFTAQGHREDAPTEIGVWAKDAGGTWYLRNTIPTPSAYPYVVSPEFLVVDGVSYVSWLASNAPLNLDNGQSQVWLASIDPAHGVIRRISNATLVQRKDPEPFTGGAEPWVYYTEVVGDRRVLHRVTLGL